MRFETRPARWLVVIVSVVFCCALQAAEPVERDFARGVVISCPRAGQIWGSPQMTQALAEVGELGAEWIAIHPYAGIGRDGTVRFRRAADTEYLDRAISIAKEAGMGVFWKPHLAYWGSFEWRIEFGNDEAAWRRFFDTYLEFILDQARFAEQADVKMLAVGVEYEKTTHREAEWRRLIAAVRRSFSGRITYAANWDSLDKVPFWDAIDTIGVHAYYPLVTDSDPAADALWSAWNAPLAELQNLSEAHGNKPVLFAEIGYARSPTAASQPWLPRNADTPEIRQLRRRLIETALRRVEATPFVEGMFWWKWIPGDNRWDRDFSMRDPEAKAALAEYWSTATATHATAE